MNEEDNARRKAWKKNENKQTDKLLRDVRTNAMEERKNAARVKFSGKMRFALLFLPSFCRVCNIYFETNSNKMFRGFIISF